MMRVAKGKAAALAFFEALEQFDGPVATPVTALSWDPEHGWRVSWGIVEGPQHMIMAPSFARKLGESVLRTLKRRPEISEEDREAFAAVCRNLIDQAAIAREKNRKREVPDELLATMRTGGSA